MPRSARYTLAVTDPDRIESLTARLWTAGAMGVWQRPGELVAWFADRGAPVPPGGRWEDEPDRDWQAEWKATIEPVTAGRITIVPTWLADAHAPSPGDLHIVLDPGRAFGSGHHATTTQCLELLQDLELSGARVLDVGTGTGVLAIGAALLGATWVVGVDVDADAVDVARENAAANDVSLELTVGSIGAAAGSPFDVVCANLVTDTIVALAAELVAATRPGGVLVASGIATQREDRGVGALVAAGLEPYDIRRRDGWTALAGRAQEPS